MSRRKSRVPTHEFFWLVYSVVESKPKFYGFLSKRAADEFAGKIAGAKTQIVQVIDRDQAEEPVNVEALIG